MSNRDIDSTSENVLHDWAREEPHEEVEEADEVAEPDEESSPAWGTAAAAVDVESEDAPEVSETVEVEPTDDVSEIGDGELDETPMHIELSHEHAMGDLHIPDGYAVLEGVAEGGRRAVGVVVSRFNGSVTSQLLDSALARAGRFGRATGRDHDHGRPRSLRASAGGNRAREDAPFRLHRRPRLRHPR